MSRHASNSRGKRPAERANRLGSLESRSAGPGWREAAMNEALLAEASDGDGLYALLRRVRIHMPRSSTLTIDGLEAPRYATFLNERIGSLKVNRLL
jgi:hypothetical protein